MGETERVVRDVLLHRFAHLRCSTEETVRRHEPSQSLVWPLEVVAVDEEREPAREVGEVREDRAAEELVPQRLPESLCLAQRLWMLGTTPDVPNPILPERALEVRLSAPGCVLPAVVRENLLGRPVLCKAELEGLHH